jgi:hypothetical protein
MDSLPIELYRCIFEVTERRDLLRLVVVNRTFQVEIERLLHHKVILGDSIKWIVIGCRRLLALPRFHPLVHRLCIFQFSSDPKAVRFLSCRTILASLLEKLTNLVSLTTRILPEEVIWRKCGTLFRNCTFQLRILRCPFALDADFASFLESQNSLSELEWCPHTPPIRHLSRTALPNLRILACHSDFFEELAPELLTGRPITHIASNFGKPPIPKDLPLSTAPIRALKLPWPDIGMLKSIPEHCPQLELLAFVDLDTVDVSLLYHGNSQMLIRVFRRRSSCPKFYIA